MAKRTKEEARKAHFDGAVNSINYWRLHADALERASEVLWQCYADAVRQYEAEAAKTGSPVVIDAFNPDSWLPDVSLMLLGLTVEAQLKGAISLAEPPSATHDLVKLAEQLQMPMNVRQRELLEQLHGYVVWRGRYPAPLERDRRTADVNGPLGGAHLDELTALLDAIKAFGAKIEDDLRQNEDHSGE